MKLLQAIVTLAIIVSLFTVYSEESSLGNLTSNTETSVLEDSQNVTTSNETVEESNSSEGNLDAANSLDVVLSEDNSSSSTETSNVEGNSIPNEVSNVEENNTDVVAESTNQANDTASQNAVESTPNTESEANIITPESTYTERSASVENNTNITQSIKMDIITRDKDSSGNSVYSYLTGKEIRPQADILVSGTDVNYPNGRLVLKVPKTTTNGVSITKPSFISSKEAESSVESTTDTHYVMTYTYRQIKGGLIGTYDFPIRFPNEITFNGDTIPVIWEMQDENGNVIKSVSRVFTAISSSTWSTDKVIFDDHNLVTRDDPWVGNPRTDGYQELRLHFTDKPVRTHTSSTVDSTNKVNYYIDALFEPQNGAETQYGIYNPQTITFIDKIPEGGTYENIDLEYHAKLTGAKIISKEYNETTREVKMKVEISKMQDLWGKSNRRGLRASVHISYLNQPIDTIHRNVAQVITDEGLPSEQVLNEAAWSIKFRDFYYKSQTPAGFERTGNFALDTFREWNYTYNPDAVNITLDGVEATKGLLYSTKLNGYNNGSGFNNSVGIYTALKNVLYRQLDSRLYASSFSFSTWDLTNKEREALNNTPNKLWGIKENGDKVLIAENIKVSSNDIPREKWDIQINDINQEYKQLLLEWPETPLILDNDTQYLDLFMKPIPAEMEKFKNFEYTGSQVYEVYTKAEYDLINNSATIEKNSNGEFSLKSGQLPKNAVLNPQTGEVTIPKEDLVLNSSITSSSTRITPSVASSARSMVRVNHTSLGTPIISFADDFTAYVYPNEDTRVTRTEVVFSHASGERLTLIAEKTENGWGITSDIPTGVSIDQSTGKITIQSDSIISDSDINSIHRGVDIDGERIYSRTPYVDAQNKTIIRPSTPSLHETENSIIIKPSVADTNSYIFYYSPTVKSLADYTYTELTKNEAHYNNNWNKIEFPWIKARLENGSDHNIYYSSVPGANHRELFTRGLVGGAWPTSDFVANYKTITLLPSGVNFVRDAGEGIKSNASNATTTPEVVENFRGTGRTAVIYSYDLTKKSNVNDTQHLNGAYYTSKFIVDITGQAEDGDNIVEHFLIWDRDNIIKPNHNTYKDVLDLDGDGDTENDVFIRTTNRLTLILPYEVSGKKQVSIDKVNWTLTAPPQDIGGDVYYRINATNNSIRNLPNFKIFDVLPAINDHKIIENENGDYLQRGTQFVTPLVEAIEDVPENAALLSKWDFFYSTTPQGSDFISSYNVEWKTKDEITDWSTVKSIKIELKAGQEFLTREEINIIVHAQIPYDKSMPIFQKAFNSFAISTLGDNYAEVNEVVSTNIKYEVDGVVFFDVNKNGIHDNGELLLKGYELTLVDKNGVPYVDRGTKKPITAITDENGFYHMDVYERGEYYVRVSKKNIKEQFTSELYKVDGVDERGAPIKILKPGTKLSVDGVIGNDTTQDTDLKFGNTPLFKLNPVTRIATRNAGIILANGTIEIKKVDENNNALENISFQLYKGDTLVSEVITDENGIAKFEDIEFGQYKLKEVPNKFNEQFVLMEDKDVVIDENVPDLKLTLEVINSFIRSNISIKKVDYDNNTKALSGVVFGLFDKTGQKIEEKITDNNGEVLFENVKFGNYTIKEISTLENYNLNLEEIEVNVNKDKELKIYTVTNELKKGDVVITKVDSKNNKIKLEGVEFVLEQDGVVKYKELTDKNGILKFKDVVYGKYILKETNTIKGYVLNTDKLEVNIDSEGKVINHTVENEKITADIVFRKVDGMNNSINIKGASFALFDASGKFLQESVSDADGMVYFLNVEYGNYTIKELKAAEGYNISHETIKVEVKEHRKTLDLGKIVNYKLYNAPYTGTKGTLLSNFVMIILSSLGLFFVKKKK